MNQGLSLKHLEEVRSAILKNYNATGRVYYKNDALNIFTCDDGDIIMIDRYVRIVDFSIILMSRNLHTGFDGERKPFIIHYPKGPGAGWIATT